MSGDLRVFPPSLGITVVSLFLFFSMVYYMVYLWFNIPNIKNWDVPIAYSAVLAKITIRLQQ